MSRIGKSPVKLPAKVSVTEASRLRRQMTALLELSLASAKVIEPERQAQVALDEIVRIVGGERAFLFISPDGGETLQLQAGRSAEGADLEPRGSLAAVTWLP